MTTLRYALNQLCQLKDERRNATEKVFFASQTLLLLENTIRSTQPHSGEQTNLADKARLDLETAWQSVHNLHSSLAEQEHAIQHEIDLLANLPEEEQD